MIYDLNKLTPFKIIKLLLHQITLFIKRSNAFCFFILILLNLYIHQIVSILHVNINLVSKSIIEFKIKLFIYFNKINWYLTCDMILI